MVNIKARSIFATVVISCVTTACGIPQPSSSLSSGSSKLDSMSLSATQVVQDYYRYIAEHDVQSASQFLTPDMASFYRSAPDSDFNNINSISDVVVSKPYNIGLDNKYKQEVQVDVNYAAKYKQVITETNGQQTRFIYLGRNSNRQPWKIISIGTGP